MKRKAHDSYSHLTAYHVSLCSWLARHAPAGSSVELGVDNGRLEVSRSPGSWVFPSWPHFGRRRFGFAIPQSVVVQSWCFHAADRSLSRSRTPGRETSLSLSNTNLCRNLRERMPNQMLREHYNISLASITVKFRQTRS